MTRTTRTTAKQITLGLFAASALALLGMSITACNTAKGVGEDIESLGDGIADTAEDARDGE